MLKLRNQLLALFCILVFAALGWLYIRTWVVQQPFGVILFVSDGLATRHLTTARLYRGGADHRLELESFPHLAILRNSAEDFAVPDDAAAGTAFATGHRVSHRSLAVDPAGRALPSLMELAREKGRAVGIVTNGPLTAPTPAAFYAHLQDARQEEETALQMFQRPLDVALGGGASLFLPPNKGGRRRDGRDLLGELRGRGAEILSSKAELENAAAYRTGPLLGVFAPGALPFSTQIESGSQQPTLSDMVRRAIVFLQQNRTGYFLVVDAALVGTAAERNEGERTLAETLALDDAVAMAGRYVGEKSLIIAAGRHATGGLSLNGYPLRQDHGVALLGTNPAGYPQITWATGPNGPAVAAIPGEPTPPADAARRSEARKEPAAHQTPAALNTAEDVIAVGRGQGAERLGGFMNNTDVFGILKDAL